MTASSKWDFKSKVALMKVDLHLEDICRLWSTVPSDYIYPKMILTDVRANLRSDVNKSSIFAEKARKAFEREAAVAMKFNIIKDKLALIKDKDVAVLTDEYKDALRAGDYKTADGIVEKLYKNKNTVGEAFVLEVLLRSVSGDRAIVELTNKSGDDVHVSRVSVSSGTGNMDIDCYSAYLTPHSTKTVTCRSKDAVTEAVCVDIEYESGGIYRSIQEKLEV